MRVRKSADGVIPWRERLARGCRARERPARTWSGAGLAPRRAVAGAPRRCRGLLLTSHPASRATPQQQWPCTACTWATRRSSGPSCSSWSAAPAAKTSSRSCGPCSSCPPARPWCGRATAADRRAPAEGRGRVLTQRVRLACVRAPRRPQLIYANQAFQISPDERMGNLERVRVAWAGVCPSSQPRR